MATNTGKNFRRGAVKHRSQVENPRNEDFTKRDESGKFIDQKEDKTPFKGVRKEHKS
ncbi:hypothetical protein B9G69_012350 [Bdellovibrio sp. SKB1291214]|uniref:hypothetical protein n=1 Tax=Bdellovibrio sp. SKB1291214 TaxID=1732569 RepID=UPI001595942B|nr:hypothetical protein [Bdellovibrio sp. SKB1291214]UYL07837.1 hypothetical protein B9G69_012350 [Bdellovibrio sp. SKB1291214]